MDWRPTKRELAVELVALVVLPAASAIDAVIEGRPIWAVILITLGVLLLVMSVIAVWTVLRPRQPKILEGKELIDTIDGWLRDLGFNRRTEEVQGVHALTASYGEGDAQVYIIEWKQRNTIIIAAARTESAADAAVFAQMDQTALSDIVYDLTLEVGRLGAFLNTG